MIRIEDSISHTFYEDERCFPCILCIHEPSPYEFSFLPPIFKWLDDQVRLHGRSFGRITSGWIIIGGTGLPFLHFY